MVATEEAANFLLQSENVVGIGTYSPEFKVQVHWHIAHRLHAAWHPSLDFSGRDVIIRHHSLEVHKDISTLPL